LNRFEVYFLNTHADAAKFAREVNHPACGIMYDTFHSNIEEKDPVGAIKTIRKHMIHVHISENDRGTPGDGHVPWDETFAALASIHFNGWLTIEAFSRNDPDFANAINVWREYSAPWDIATKGLAFIKQNCDKHNLK